MTGNNEVPPLFIMDTVDNMESSRRYSYFVKRMGKGGGAKFKPGKT